MSPIQSLTRHPIAVTAVGGIILALLGHHLEEKQAATQRSIVEREKEIERIEEYFDHYSKSFEEFFFSVENWLLDYNQISRGSTDLFPDRLGQQAREINAKVIGVVTALDKARIVGQLEESESVVTELLQHVSVIKAGVQSVSSGGAGHAERAKVIGSTLYGSVIKEHRRVVGIFERHIKED